MAQGNMKIAQISKDLNMKTKDIIDAFHAKNIEKKSGGAVEIGEFEILMESLMNSHQIKNIESYLEGSVTIVGEKPVAPVREEVKKVEVKTEVTPAAPAQKSAVPAAKAPASKPQPTVTDAKAKPAEKTVKSQDAGMPEEKLAGRTFTFHPDGRTDEKKNTAPRPANPNGQQGQNRQNGNGNTFNRPRDDRAQRPQQERRSQYRDAPQDDPFAKRRADLNRQAQGLRKPGQPMGDRPATAAKQGFNNTNAQAKPSITANVAKPVANTAAPASVKSTSPAGPAQLNALERQKQAESRQNQQMQNAAKKAAAPKKEEKKQKQQFKTIAPSADMKKATGGINIGAEMTSDTAPKTRVVDMRTSDVNLSRYDDHFNDQFYAIVNGTDAKNAPNKQKLKKQDNKGQNQKTAKDKERAAQERIKRMEAEKARHKQLEITVPDEITVGELAIRLKKTSGDVVKKLMMMGEMKMVNDVIDYSMAELIADEFGAKVTKEIVITKEEKLFTEAEDDPDSLVERAPVVCVMGHVDHGKTSILDAIRHTSVTKGEAGGITQAIGAYRVKAKGKDITFLDTPGHEAFTAMRMRGAQSTDIAILVVAADDGVMPQTVEAINHAKAAGIDIIVAINKMDKPTANPDNILNQLTQYELVPEAWGGDVICVPVSALTGMGIDDLLESVLLVAEVKELKANPKRRAKGIVIESKLDRGRGPVATILVQNGTLHQGDYVIVGDAVGRVRVMVDDKGKNIKEAGPSVPVEIVGLDAVPQAGDELNAVEDEKMAKSLAEDRREKARQDILNANARVNLDELFSQISEGVKTLNIIVKADVAGSAEAIKASLMKLSGEEVKVNVIHTAVGGITESDVMLAAASNAIIVGFSVRPDKNALDSAERNKVDIRTHRIIYEIIDEIEAAMKGMLAPTFKENLLGHVEVRQCIHVPNVGTIAGSYVTDGKVTRQSQIRVVRDGIVIFEDKISSLRRFKDDVREVATGYECGIGLEKFNDIKEGDILEAFVMEEVAR